MNRALRATAGALVISLALAGTAAWADSSGGGTRRWAASYLQGAPAFSDAVTLSPDGSTVFVTGTTQFGPAGHFATLAYDAATGAEKWAANYPAASNPEYGRGNALAVSPDGSTLFVTGSSSCYLCDGSSYEGYSTIAYEAATGSRKWVARFDPGIGPYSIVVSPDGSKVFVNGQTGDAETSATVAYDAATGARLWVIDHATGPVYWTGGVSVSPDGLTLYVVSTAQMHSGSCGYHTAAYSTSSGTARWSATYKIDNGSLCGTATDLDMSADGSRLFVTGYGGSFGDGETFGSATVAYSALNGHQLWAITDDNIRVPNGNPTVPLGVSPDGATVFVLGSDCTDDPTCTLATVAYDATSGARLWTSRYDGGGSAHAYDLAVSADGSTVFITGNENMPCYDPCTTTQFNAPLIAYDAANGDERWVTTYPDNQGWALAVDPDGSSVYLAGTFTASRSASTTDGRRGGERAATCSATACGYSTTRYNTGPGPGTIQDPEPALTYSGWRSFFDKSAIGGAYRGSRIAGASATFRTPAATSITWLTRQGPDQGMARVLIDGEPTGTFNLYSSTATDHSVEFTDLAPTAHTVKVEVLGAKDPGSSGTWVALDGFEMTVGSGITQETSPAIHYNSWTGVSRASASGGSYRQTGSPTSRMSLTFTGRTVKWITATGPSYGRARVVIDGKAHTVDLYRRTRDWKVAVTFGGLAKQEHHVTVRPLGTKNAESRSTKVVVDAFVIR